MTSIIEKWSPDGYRDQLSYLVVKVDLASISSNFLITDLASISGIKENSIKISLSFDYVIPRRNNQQ